MYALSDGQLCKHVLVEIAETAELGLLLSFYLPILKSFVFVFPHVFICVGNLNVISSFSFAVGLIIWDGTEYAGKEGTRHSHPNQKSIWFISHLFSWNQYNSPHKRFHFIF